MVQKEHSNCAFNLITRNEVHNLLFIYLIGWQGWERKGGKEGGRREKGINFSAFSLIKTRIYLIDLFYSL